MIKSDQWIFEQDGMITPISNKVNQGMSYGIGSYGYDIRLSDKDFQIYTRIHNQEIDPKDFDPIMTSKPIIKRSDKGVYVVLPSFSAGLGVSLERFNIPHNVMALVLGKSTYARCGLVVNTTPLEPGWGGHITLEFFNTTPYDMRLYCGEGIAQVLFFEGVPPYQSYNGKYQNQQHQVTFPK